MTKIQVRRGTNAQLTTLGALSVGELGYTTDSRRLYVGNGAGGNTLIGTENPWGNNTYPTRPFGTVAHSVVQSLPTSVSTKINFTTKNVDNLNEFDANGKYTATQTGIYTVKCALSIATDLSSGAYVQLYLFVNGTAAFMLGKIGDVNIAFSQVIGSVDLYMTAGDYLEIFLYPSKAVSTGNDTKASYMSVMRMA